MGVVPTQKQLAALIRELPERDDLPYETVLYRYGLVIVSWCGTVGTVRVETDGRVAQVIWRQHGQPASCAIVIGRDPVPGHDLVAVLRATLAAMCPGRVAREEGGEP